MLFLCVLFLNIPENKVDFVLDFLRFVYLHLDAKFLTIKCSDTGVLTVIGI